MFATGDESIHRAAVQGDLEGIRGAYEAGADLNAYRWDDGELAPPLCAAARTGRRDAVALLLDLGVSVDSANEWGGTALHYAVQHGHLGVAELLLARGADPDLSAEGCTPLMTAARIGNHAGARLLIEHGASVGVRDRVGATAMSWARQRADEEMVAMLKAAGAVD